MSGLISGIGPERAPNGDFGGRSFQGVSGPPTGVRSLAPAFPGVGNKPGSDIGGAPILRDTPGRRSNATVQYHRVVPMGTPRENAETRRCVPGNLVFVYNDRSSGSRRMGQGVEKMSRIVSWDYLTEMIDPMSSNAGGGGGGGGAQNQDPYTGGDAVQRLQQLTENASLSLKPIPGARADQTPANIFQLDVGGAFQDSPFLMWKDWNAETPVKLRDPANDKKGATYANLNRVKKLWSVVYNGDEANDKTGLLRTEKLGKFVPDGVVLYKYSTQGQDEGAEAMLDAAQNGLFNIVVSGHAMCSTWSVFERHTRRSTRLLTLPRDTLYILVKGKLVTDVNYPQLIAAAKSAYDQAAQHTKSMGDVGKATNEQDVTRAQLVLDRLTSLKPNANGSGSKLPCVIDLQMWRSTSEDLHRNAGGRLVDGAVALGEDEVVLGAWRIGTIVDSAASRAVPSGGIGTSSVAATMGLTVSVGIRWTTSYELHDLFWKGSKALTKNKKRTRETTPPPGV